MQIKRQIQGARLAQAVVLLAAISSGSIALDASCGLPPATHTHYRFTTVDIQGAVGPIAFAINNEGLVSGFYSDSSGYYHGFLWRNGTGTTVNAPGGWVDTELGGVNDSGVAIGNYDDDLTVSHATLYFVWNQTWRRLPDVPGWPLNFGNGINDDGAAVGAAYQGSTPSTAYNGVSWIWDGRGYSFFTVPGSSGTSTGTYASGINDFGKVTGYYEDGAGGVHGFLKEGRDISSFDVPGADYTYANGINDQDEVVGTYVAAGVAFGYVMREGEFVTVDVPGAAVTNIFGINDLGQIVGWYSDTSSGTGYGFVGTPFGDEH